jgi:hypothetical protein
MIMKRITFALLVFALSSAVSLAYHHGPCLEGNDALTVERLNGDIEIACCVPVGDGSAYSCTDGDDWFNALPIQD